MRLVKEKTLAFKQASRVILSVLCISGYEYFISKYAHQKGVLDTQKDIMENYPEEYKSIYQKTKEED